MNLLARFILFAVFTIPIYGNGFERSNSATPSPALQVYIHESIYNDLKEILKKAIPFPVTFRPFPGSLQRFILQNLKRKPLADVLVGVDLNQLDLCQDLAAPISVSVNLDLPFAWEHPHILPFSYAYLTILYNADLLPLQGASLPEVLEHLPTQSLAAPDPRTSMVGQDFLSWLSADKTSFDWKILHQKVHTYTSGWYGAFHLFIQRKVKAMVGYTTSEIYHHQQGHSWVKALLLNEGHPIQPMLMLALKKEHAHPNATALIKILLSKEVQQHLPTKNFSYPVISLSLPQAFVATRPPKGFLLKLSSTQQTNLRRVWQATAG